MTGNKKMVGTSKQEISQEEEVLRSINNSIETMFDNVPPLLPEYSIYHVPERIRNVNEDAYTPMVVSIGPYHHGKEKYKTMEYHKLRYLYSNIFRDEPLRRLDLHECVKALLKLERSAREFYAEAIFFTKDELVKLMLVDGFFIVELIRQYHNPDLINDLDPIFKNDWIFNAVHRDMLLLENQLPYTVLETLFTLINQSDYIFRTDCPFLELAYGFLGYYKPTKQCRGHSVGLHLLHLSQQGFISPMQPKIPRTNDDSPFDRAFIIASATELHEAGIKFQYKEEPRRHLLEVEFTNGVLCIPPLVVDDRTESLFRNLLAFEQQSHSGTITNLRGNSVFSPAFGIKNQHYGGSTPVTDYVTLMDCLINTSADVALLRKCKIIQNRLGDNEEVAQLFNKLRSGIITRSTEFYFFELFEKVNMFYNTRWHALKEKLRRDYFNTPWASLSFVAAVFLLICTLVQTVFSILQVLKK